MLSVLETHENCTGLFGTHKIEEGSPPLKTDISTSMCAGPFQETFL